MEGSSRSLNRKPSLRDDPYYIETKNELSIGNSPSEKDIFSFTQIFYSEEEIKNDNNNDNNENSLTELWNDAVSPLCNEMLQGYNIAIIVYGGEQTGKTYTMFGSPENDQLLGIAKFSVKSLVEKLKNQKIEKKM